MPKHRRLRVGDMAIEVMKESGMTSVGYVGCGDLDEIFVRAKKKGILREAGSRGGRGNPHPLNRHIAVLNCIDRDERFEKHLMRCTNGRAEVLVRIFYLRGLEEL